MIRMMLMCTLLLALTGPAWSGPAAAGQAAPAAPESASVARLDLNTASVSDLETLPGIGPRTAALIVEYREQNGGFQKIEELMNVRGVGEKSFLRLKDLITVSPVQTEESGTGATR